MPLHPDILALGSPADSDIEIVQGDGRTFLRTLRKRNVDGSYTPYNITGWVFRLQVRVTYDAVAVLIAATVVPTANAALGEYSETWSAADTAALAIGIVPVTGLVQLGFYDLDVSMLTDTITLKRGSVILRRQVSRT